MKDLCNILMNDHVERAVRKFGVEGTLEVIERVYKLSPVLKEKYLNFFRKKYHISSN